jgi:hypothetical protein
MAATPEFICICGIQKKVSNHWVLARFTPLGIEFMPWDLKLALDDNVIVLCGEGCATAALSRCLGEWNHAHSVTPAVPPLTESEEEQPFH